MFIILLQLVNKLLIKKTSITLFLITLFSTPLKAQNIDSLYTNYFQDTRELPYLHLNKTTFIKGEEIWFQAYVTEQNSNTLHKTTSNLYVSIFDENGKQKEQHLIHIKNGIGHGNILIDSTFTKNAYYLKASTNWMKNFNEDHSFIQKITVLSDRERDNKISINEKKFYEFKIFPEGGHLISNTINNIGILIKDVNNRGVKISKGKIKNRSGTVIGQFNTNHLGLGSVSFFTKENEIYTFEATLTNGTVIHKKTNSPELIGITLNTNVIDDYFILNILTNDVSLTKLKNKKYRILTHNTRSFKNIYFNFNNTDKTYTLILKKNELPKGINIVTIFNENNIPVIERLIFNDFEEFQNQLNISNSKIKSDSITTILTNNSSEKLFLSASFLPTETKAYKPTNTIKSQIALKPYVKGHIENPQYYFNNNYKDLDLLLLTQGWSKYNWDDIFNNATDSYFDFETGIDITATFNKKIKSNQSVLIFSKANKLIREISNDQNPLVLKNTFIKKNSTVDFGLKINDNIYKITPYLQYSNSYLKDTFNKNYLITNKDIELETSDFGDLSKDITILDEVILSGNKRKLDNKPYGGVTMLRNIKMKDLMNPTGETIIQFLTFKGYQYDGDGFSPKGIDTKRDEQNSSSESEGIELDSEGLEPDSEELGSVSNVDDDKFNRPLVRVYLNDKEVTFNIWVIENINTNMVKEIFYGKVPGRFAQVIHIYTFSPHEYYSKKTRLTKLKLPVGFTTEKEYYSPLYPSFSNSTFREFGAIYWQPNITIEANSSLNITVPIYYQKELKIFVEGTSEIGTLISKTQLINID
ncbi:hypothetical protein [Olleya sp. ITB9]|uniref:hypothetical protein n=1 Tax=Olleya sp. ITB9 TaxID=1715648 RepID=UPI000A91EE54|nr:hypothetical protein [Olleya sp. ITB9]